MSNLPAPCLLFPWLHPVQLFRHTLSASEPNMTFPGKKAAAPVKSEAVHPGTDPVVKPCKCSFHSIHQCPSVPLFGLQPHRALHASPYGSSPRVPANIKQASTKATLPQLFPNAWITQSGQVLQRVPLLQPHKAHRDKSIHWMIRFLRAQLNSWHRHVVTVEIPCGTQHLHRTGTRCPKKQLNRGLWSPRYQDLCMDITQNWSSSPSKMKYLIDSCSTADPAQSWSYQ